MSAPLVSVILPTWNGERDLERLLPRLSAQRLDGGLEIRAIDSSSDDRTVELLRAAGASVEVIDRASFGHGRTRNRAAAGASGRFLVFLSQDAEPRDEDSLARLVAAFDDPKVGGAFGRVLPRPGDDPLTRRTVLELPEASERPGVQEPGGGGRPRFNDVASAIRTEAFRRLPLPDVDFGEDVAWARAALADGWRIRFAADAVFLHAHSYSAAGAFARYRIDAEHQLREYGERVRPGPVSVLKGLLFEVGRDLRFLARDRGPGRLAALVRSPVLRGAQVLGQWVGSRGDGA